MKKDLDSDRKKASKAIKNESGYKKKLAPMRKTYQFVVCPASFNYSLIGRPKSMNFSKKSRYGLQQKTEICRTIRGNAGLFMAL